MDPLTHGLLGATTAGALAGARLPRTALLAGFLGGIVPDADVLIRSADPLVGLVYHRHFTHSLFLAPLLGALAAAPLLLVPRFRPRWCTVLAAGVIGCLTHGLLDACTGHGTLLFWPFTTARISWDILPIIDLVFTPILLLGVLLVALLRRALPARFALAAVLAYTLAGVWMNGRALQAQQQLAEARGHAIEAGRAIPTPGTLVLWRSVYRSGGRIYADSVRTPWLGETLARPGSDVPLLTSADLPATVTADQDALRGFRTFSWFADGYTALIPKGDRFLIGDYRYGGDTREAPLWGLELLPGETPAYRRWYNGGRGDYASRLWRNLVDGDPEMMALSHWAETWETSAAW